MQKCNPIVQKTAMCIANVPRSLQYESQMLNNIQNYNILPYNTKSKTHIIQRSTIFVQYSGPKHFEKYQQ